MKQLALLALTLCSISVFGQKIFLKSGEFTPSANVRTIDDFATWTNAQFESNTYCILQFEQASKLSERENITKETGIRFYDYFPSWAFLVSIPSNLDVSTLGKYKIRSVLPYIGKYKIAPKLNLRPFPSWMDKGNGKIELLLEIQAGISQTQAAKLLNAEGIGFANWKSQQEVIVVLSENQINTLAQFPWVKYLQATSAPTVYENLTERSNHRVNTIDAAYVTGLHYDGTGVSVGVGDDGLIGEHIDFEGRVVNHTSSNLGTHGDHVSGIVAGGGNFDPVTSGNARGADLHIYTDYNNLLDAPTDYNTQGIRITSNSLGQGCNVGYDADARDADILVRSKLSLMSVHSAGNSGGTSCGGVPQGFYTITGGYKAGKNVMAIGNVDNSDVIAPSSSRGPSEDGRIKPEIVAVGTDVYSTQPDNTYDTFTGTSMSCPGVSGTLASLWQAYRETHSGQDPNSALMKAVVMNTADDLGNKGPDFIYGYGRINARRAYRALSNNQFFIDSVDAGDSKDFFINVPPNTRQLKVMLYWNDFQGSPTSSVALVNDLNLSVQEPSGNVIDPWILDNTPSVAALSTPAIRGIDHLNNVEQVTIDSIFSGACILTVDGIDVPQGPQKFVIVYEFISDNITLTYPQGGESFVHGVKERVRWDAFGNNAGTFKLEYSTNAGGTWNTISSSIPGNQRYFDWTPPFSINTGRMLMKITRGTFFDESDTLFTVYDVPKNLTVDTACGSIMHLKWDAVPLANEYKIYMMGPKYMMEIGTSPTNDYFITSGVNTTDTFYFAVSAVRNSNFAKGLRSIAYQKLPGLVNCVDNAYNVETILPFSSTYTCAVTGPIPIKMKIKNIGFRPLTNLPVYYKINANPVVSDVMPGPLNIGDSIIFTFATLANVSAPITYTVTTWSSVYTDVVVSNDTTQTTALVEFPTVLTAPTIQDFEGPLFPPTGWKVIDADVNVKWQKTLCLVDPLGFNSHAAYMDFFNYGNLSQIDDLESAQFDLTSAVADSVFLTFDLSHAYGPKAMDSLQVLVSEDCGLTYTTILYDKGGAPLATAGLMSTIFSPTATSQWRNDRIEMTNYIGKKIFVRFRGINGKGNNLFLDNINLILKDAWPLGFSSFENELVSIYPNPSDGNYFMEFNSNGNKVIRYTVFNLSGQKLKDVRMPISAGKTKMALDLTSYAKGMYLLEFQDGSSSKKVKLVKY